MGQNQKKIIAIGGGGFTHRSDEVLDKFSDIKTIDFNFKKNDSINVVKRKEKNKFFNHKNFELNIGDHVIHKDYGLGLFEGFQNIKTSNHENEFGVIQYKNKELSLIHI